MPKRKPINMVSTRHVRRLINEEALLLHQYLFLDEDRSSNLDSKEENSITSNIVLNSSASAEYSNEQIVFDAHIM